MPTLSFAQLTNKFTPEFYTVIDTSKVIHSCNGSDPEDIKKGWIISFKEMSILENNFKKIHKYFSGDRIDSLIFFTFQYFGVWKDSSKCIYINALPTNEMAEWERFKWKTEPITVCGGGDNFWRALFNIDTREFIYLEFNAPR
ncbi:MAG: hypothetical protein ABI921_04440 [Panacibacter sp.]